MRFCIFPSPWNIFGLLTCLAEGSMVEAVAQNARGNFDPADTMKM